MDERRAQLLAAAEALRTWVQTQRTTWSGDDPPALPARRSQGAAPEPTPVTLAPAVAPDSLPQIPPPIEPRERADAVMQALRALALRCAPIMRVSWRVAAVGAIVVGGVIALRAAWPDTKAIVTSNLEAGRRAVDSGRRTINATVDPEPSISVSAPVNLEAVVARLTGRLEVQSDPIGAQVFIDGRERGVTPLTIEALASGSHTVLLRSAEGSVQRTVSISPAQTTQVSEAIFSGFLHVSSPIELQISEGGRAIRLDDSNQVLLAAGAHDLRFENRALGFLEVRRVTVEPGDRTSVSVDPRPVPLSVTSTEAATVFVDGERAGETPLVNFPVTVGTRELTVTSASGEVLHRTLTITAHPSRVDFVFSKR